MDCRERERGEVHDHMCIIMSRQYAGSQSRGGRTHFRWLLPQLPPSNMLMWNLRGSRGSWPSAFLSSLQSRCSPSFASPFSMHSIGGASSQTTWQSLSLLTSPRTSCSELPPHRLTTVAESTHFNPPPHWLRPSLPHTTNWWSLGRSKGCQLMIHYLGRYETLCLQILCQSWPRTTNLYQIVLLQLSSEFVWGKSPDFHDFIGAICVTCT